MRRRIRKKSDPRDQNKTKGINSLKDTAKQVISHNKIHTTKNVRRPGDWEENTNNLVGELGKLSGQAYHIRGRKSDRDGEGWRAFRTSLQ